jgi:hypothetical protein
MGHNEAGYEVMDWVSLRKGTNEHRNELSAAIKYGVFLDRLNDYQFPKKYFGS